MSVLVTNNAKGVAEFNEATPLNVIVDFVDSVKERPRGRGKELVPLLSEGHPLYAGRTANEVLKLRAYAMAALELTGLPDAAMPYVRESLESSLHPYTIAGAARALRGTNLPAPGIIELLFKAVFRIWQSDRPVSFEEYRAKWPQREVSSGLTEIFQSLTHFGPGVRNLLPALELLANDKSRFSDKAYADLVSCIEAIKKKSESHRAKSEKFEIAPAQASEQQRSRVGAWPPRNLKLEDQDGNLLRWDAFFGHKPTLLAYFYTRCGNPYKCTRTILNLSLIQDEIEQRGLSGRVRISAISYDSQFDTPAALKSYGDARNFQFNDDCRMFRVSEGFGQLIEQMELEVSYLQSQVSSHRIELFVIDASGDVVNSFVRVQSNPSDVVDALVALAKGDPVQ